MNVTNIVRRTSEISHIKRCYSSFRLEDTDLQNRKDKLAHHFTGRPFDNEGKFKVPENDLINETLKLSSETNLPSPFVSFDSTMALKYALNINKAEQGSNKYHRFLRLDHDNMNKFQSQMDLLLSWRKKFSEKLAPVPESSAHSNLRLTDDLRQQFLTSVETTVPFDFTKAIEKLSETLPHLPLESLVSLYVKITPFLTEAQRDEFLHQMNEYFTANIHNFHDQTLEEICSNFLISKNAKSVTTIISAYDSNSNTEFLSMVPISFSQTYLINLIENRDVKIARHVLDYIVTQGYKPSFEVVNKYMELITQTLKTVPEEKSSKEMLFNLLTKPLFVVLTKPGMLNTSIVDQISEFVRLHNLELFIQYLKQNPDYKKMPEIAEILLGRIDSSTTYLKKKDQSKATFLTGTLKQLGFSPSELSESSKKKIITLYAQCHSPLAVVMWSKTLKTALNPAERINILELLEGDSDNVTQGIDISGQL